MKTNHPTPSERDLFLKALDHSSEEARRRFLDEACKNDSELRQRLESLLADHKIKDSFLNDPAGEELFTDTIEEATIPTEKPGETIGRYKLLQKIGEGGMGIVYMAEQTEPVTRKVALKIIKLGMDTKQVVARFEAERQALAMMEHPNIAKVLDAGSTDTGRPYFVMELVRGVPITEYCDKNKLPNEARLNLFLPICQAIQHAHQKGVIHRDIKPTNVMVTLHDGNAVPKVIDFGIAKATHQRLTEKTLFTNYAQMIGTPAYMSPEQAEMSGLDVDTRTDVYSLGVLLYELLTGTTPFPAQDLLSQGYGEMQRIISEKEPPKPSTRVKTMQDKERSIVASNRNAEKHRHSKVIQEDLDWIVMKTLEKDRSRRYDTANGLAADIRRFQASETILAHPPSRLYRFRKAWRRNKIPFTAAALVMLALGIGFTLSLVAFRQAVSAQNRERDQRHLAIQKAQEAAVAKDRAEATAKELSETLYLSRVAQAMQEVEANRPADALELLEACPPELRNWEWRYVHNRCYQTKNIAVMQFDGFLGAISPTGRHALSWNKEQLKIWTLSNNQLIGTPKSIAKSRGGAVFSHDGLLFGQIDHTENAIHISDTSTGKRSLSLVGHTNKIQSVAFHPNGRQFASGADESFLRIWNLESGQEIKKIMLEDSFNRIYGLTFSRNGKWLAAAQKATGVKIWNTETWRNPIDLPKHSVPIGGLIFSHDEEQLVSIDNTVLRIWDVSSGEELGRLIGHKLWITKVAFSPDGTRLASAGLDRKIKIWDWKNQRETLSISGMKSGLASLTFSPSGTLLAGDWNGALKPLDGTENTASQTKEPTDLIGHTNRIWALKFAPDGRLISSAEDGKGYVWHVPSERIENEFKGLFEVAVSRDGQFLATAHGKLEKTETESNFYNQLRVLDAYSMKEFSKINSTKGEFFAAEFSPDGRFLVAGGYARAENNRPQVFVWDWRNEEQLRILGEQTGGVIEIDFSPNGIHLATANEGGTVTLWEAQRLTEPQEGIQLWKNTSGFEFFKIDFSADSQRLAFGDGSFDIMILDVESGKPAMPPIQGHGDLVVCVDFSPNGKYLASGGADNTVRLWDAQTGEQLQTFLGHKGVVNEVAFSPDSRILASGGQDHDIKLWRIEEPFR